MEMTIEQFEHLNLKEIGRGIKFLRKSNNMSIQMLADNTGTQKYWISNLENGKTNFRFSMLNKLLYFFNITLLEFVEMLQEANEASE